MTSTGTGLFVVVPLPSWPKPLEPQHLTSPLRVNPQLWSMPAEMAQIAATAGALVVGLDDSCFAATVASGEGIGAGLELGPAGSVREDGATGTVVDVAGEGEVSGAPQAAIRTAASSRTNAGRWISPGIGHHQSGRR
jgi:hypothetical protein